MTHRTGSAIRATILVLGLTTGALLMVGTTSAVAQTPTFAQTAQTTTYTKQSVTLEAANAAVAAGIARSSDLGILSTVAVYDEGGTLKALATMDGARYTGVQFAMDKAWTAARGWRLRRTSPTVWRRVPR